MAIIYRRVKGVNLTPDEVDDNFEYLDERIDAAEESVASPVGIANIVQNGSTILIILDDSTELGPFTLPIATPRPTVTRTVAETTLTPGLSQNLSYFRCTNAAGCLVTIPDNADVPFPVDSELHFRQCGVGPIAFTEGSTDVLLNFRDGFEEQTDGLGSVVTVKKVGTNEWDLFGAFAETVTA